MTGLLRTALVALVLLHAAGCKAPSPQAPADSGLPAAPATTAPTLVPTAVPSDAGAAYGKPYVFSEDWFSDRIPTWARLLEPLRGKPDLHYLEVGVFEGRSALWMLENILTHPTARLTCVDIFMGNTRAVWDANLQMSGQGNKVTTL